MQIEIVLSSESASAVPGSNVPKVASSYEDREHFRRKMDLNERLGREDDLADIEKTQEELDKKVSKRMSTTVMSNFKFGTKGKDQTEGKEPAPGEKKKKKKSEDEFSEDDEDTNEDSEDELEDEEADDSDSEE